MTKNYEIGFVPTAWGGSLLKDAGLTDGSKEYKLLSVNDANPPKASARILIDGKIVIVSPHMIKHKIVGDKMVVAHEGVATIVNGEMLAPKAKKVIEKMEEEEEDDDM